MTKYIYLDTNAFEFLAETKENINLFKNWINKENFAKMSLKSIFAKKRATKPEDINISFSSTNLKNKEVSFMKNLIDFALQEKYAKVKKLRTGLEDMKKILDWGAFLKLFSNKETTRGRPEYEKTLMLKILFLQSWYSISDEEMGYQIYNRLDFQQFLDFPESIPDYSTIWRFRDELTEGEIIDDIWAELGRQTESHNIKIKQGKIQDASFIEADPGKKNSGMQRRGRDAKTSRSKDGTWTKKGKKSIFGFKSHIKVDDETKLITEVAVTTAKTFDGHVDLAVPNEVIYRDRGYSGVMTRAKGNGSMKRGKLTPHELLRNKRISKKRCRGEHPYGTMHRSFKAGRSKLTTLPRVFVQHVFVCMAYNIHRLRFLLSLDSASFV